MDERSSLDVALAFVAKINSHDVEGLVELMTPDHVFVDSLGSTFRGAKQMNQGWKGYFALFPDYSIEITDQFSRNDVVAMFGKARGTYAVNGNLTRDNCWEIPAAWRAVVQRGRMAEWRVYCDNEPVRKIMAANASKPAH